MSSDYIYLRQKFRNCYLKARRWRTYVRAWHLSSHFSFEPVVHMASPKEVGWLTSHLLASSCGVVALAHAIYGRGVYCLQVSIASS